jgi:hypothetical protein
LNLTSAVVVTVVSDLALGYTHPPWQRLGLMRMEAPMTNDFRFPEALPKLARSDYEADRGVAVLTWSDRTVTKRRVVSDGEAMRLFAEIQRNGGIKPGWAM